MAQRSVTDVAGRKWTCTSEEGIAPAQGKDVTISCATPSVAEPVRVTVGWQWEAMSEKGLARLVSHASPVPRA